MIDYHSTLVSALNKVLPTHYEMTLTSKTQTPCISYMELTNVATTDAHGATIGYSQLSYQIKIWANDIALLQRYALEVDLVLRPLGWKRVGSRELYDNNSSMIQKILTYEALASEKF